MAERAASAAPRAPARSRSGTRTKSTSLACSARSVVCSRIRLEEPFAERGVGFHDTAPDEIGARVGEHGRDGEEPAQRRRLLLEDLPRQRVTGLAVAPDQLGRPGQRLDVGEPVPRVAGQPVRQQVLLDPGQGGEALDVAAQPAVADRHRLARFQQPLQRDLDVAQFTRHAGRPAHHLARLDQAAAQPGADDDRHRGVLRRVVAEPRVVGVQRGRVGVVGVHDGQAEPLLQGGADVEAAPAGMAEVGAAPGGQDAVRAGRAGGVQARPRPPRPGPRR